jgi:hypothetical protein
LGHSKWETSKRWQDNFSLTLLQITPPQQGAVLYYSHGVSDSIGDLADTPCSKGDSVQYKTPPLTVLQTKVSLMIISLFSSNLAG